MSAVGPPGDTDVEQALSDLATRLELVLSVPGIGERTARVEEQMRYLRQSVDRIETKLDRLTGN